MLLLPDYVEIWICYFVPRSVICSLHFVESDFCPGHKQRRLKKDSVPSVFPGYPEQKKPKSPRKCRSLRKCALRPPPAPTKPESMTTNTSIRIKVIVKKEDDYDYIDESSEVITLNEEPEMDTLSNDCDTKEPNGRGQMAEKIEAIGLQRKSHLDNAILEARRANKLHQNSDNIRDLRDWSNEFQPLQNFRNKVHLYKFRCPECTSAFSSENDLMSHVILVHSEQLQCWRCSKCSVVKFTPDEFYKHFMTHKRTIALQDL